MNIKIKQVYIDCVACGRMHPFYRTCEEDKKQRAKYGEMKNVRNE